MHAYAAERRAAAALLLAPVPICPQEAQQHTGRTPLLLLVDGTDRRTVDQCQ